MKWHILFCDAQPEGCPITDFIETRPPRHQVKILRFLSLLEELGPNLPRPYADLLYDGVHELRIRLSGDSIRLLYFFCYRKYIILYFALHKTSSRVPDALIRKVITYRQRFLDRISRDDLERVVSENI